MKKWIAAVAVLLLAACADVPRQSQSRVEPVRPVASRAAVSFVGNDALTQRVSALEERAGKTAQEVERLNEKTGGVDTAMTALREKQERTDRQVTALGNTVITANSRVTELGNTVTAMNGKLAVLEKQVVGIRRFTAGVVGRLGALEDSQGIDHDKKLLRLSGFPTAKLNANDEFAACAEISKEMKKRIDEIKAVVESGWTVSAISGFADGRPFMKDGKPRSDSDNLNVDCAQKRAEAVAEALEADSGVADGRGVTSKFGGLEMNRSVLVYLERGQPQKRQQAAPPAAPQAAPTPSPAPAPAQQPAPDAAKAAPAAQPDAAKAASKAAEAPKNDAKK